MAVGSSLLGCWVAGAGVGGGVGVGCLACCGVTGRLGASLIGAAGVVGMSTSLDSSPKKLLIGNLGES